MKIQLEKVVMSNFMAYGKGPTEVSLSDAGNVLVLGENLDIGRDGESRNGAAKTTVFQAVVFALFGKGIDKMKADEFVNLTNGKKLVVSLHFLIDGKNYVIRRGRKPAILELEDGEGTSLTRDSMANTQEDIDRLVGYPYEVFMRTVFMSPHIESILALGTADQRNFIEQVLSLDVLTARAATLKDLVRKDITAELQLEQRSLENAEEQNEKLAIHVSHLRIQQDEFDKAKESRLADLQKRIEAIELPPEDIEQLQDTLNSLNEKLQTAHEDQADIREQIGAVERTIKEFERVISDVTDLEEKSSGFEQQTKDKLQSLKDALEAFESVETYQAAIDLGSEIDEIDDAIKEAKREENQTLRNAQSKETELEKVKEELLVLKDGRCPYCEQEHFDQEKVDSLQKQADALDSEVVELVSNLESVEKVVEQLEADLEVKVQSITIQPIEAIKKLKDLERARTEYEYARENSTTNPYPEMIDKALDGCSLEEYKEGLEEQKSILTEYREILKGCEQRIQGLKAEIAEVTEACHGFVTPGSVTAVEQRVVDLTDSYDAEEAKVNPYTDEIRHTEGMMKNVDELATKVSGLQADLTHVNYLIRLLTDPKSFIRKNIVDGYLPLLNKRINEYAEATGSPHIVEINADLTTDIHYMGHKVSYYMLSRGERLRVNLATSLAFRDLMELLGRKVNILMIDELLDSGSDESGIHSMFNLITQSVESTFIISHREEFKDVVDQTMTVTKQNGFAEISLD